MEFNEISVLLVVAASFGIIAKLLKQPLLIGYLFAGIVLSLTGIVHDVEIFEGLGQIGVALLLFLVGLEMNLSELPKIGKIALITGLGQILFTSLIGYGLAILLGFSSVASVYIAIALTFSSTIIIVKLLSEKNDLDSLYGKISIGFLLVQDFVAMLILILLAGLGAGGVLDPVFLGIILIKSIFIFVAVWVLGRTIMPILFDNIATSQELLFIISLAWALGFASFVAGPLGFTYEIGGFLAGLALSNLPEHLSIASKTRPLRDFFLTIFFILLGTKLIVSNLAAVIIPASIFSAFVLIGNPLIVLVIMGILGYRKRTSFLAGLTVAQISEFSFILVALGMKVGHLDENVLATVILVGVVTMTISTYMILGSDKLYKWIEKYIRIFEKKNTIEKTRDKIEPHKGHIVLIGAGKSGRNLINFLKNRKEKLIVIDYDPNIYEKINKKVDTFLLGDVSDVEILQTANVSEANLIISTLTNLADNLSLLETVKKNKNKSRAVLTAINRHEAKLLYNHGADIVIVPQEAAGEHIKHLLKTYSPYSKRIREMGKKHKIRISKI